MSGGDDKPAASVPVEPTEAAYEIGHGKPPIDTRFQKGRSGNPKGRPKKVKPAPVRFGDGHVARSFEQAALKTLKVSEGGKRVDMTVAEAVQHKMVAMALGGNRLMLQHLDKRAREEETRAQAEADEHYRFWRDYKAEQEARIAAARKAGKPVPQPLPHPADIVLDPARGRVQFLGPINPEEMAPYRHCYNLRDLMMGFAERHRRWGRKHDVPASEPCVFSLVATLLHQLLPPSHGGSDALIAAMMNWRWLGPRQLRNRIAQLEFAVDSWPPGADGPGMVRHPGNARSWLALERVGDLMVAASDFLESKAPIDDAMLEAVARSVIAGSKSGRARDGRSRR